MEDTLQYIQEGKARIKASNDIFYNPVQEFNRDLSIAALCIFAENYLSTVKRRKVALKRHHNIQPINDELQRSVETDSLNPGDKVSKEGITVLEALAATGLRSIRYALEVPKISKVYANDCSYKAVEAIRKNVKANDIENIVQPVNSDAIWLMQRLNYENKLVDVIDLDPYGCPTKFLDSAVNCIEDGGMLMITCTDMAVIAGNTPETCYIKYGAISLRSSACHEMALRIALQCIASHCGKYGKYIVPLLSFSADFYIRIFVRVFRGQQICKQTSSKVSMVYQCNGCESLMFQPLGNVTESNNTCKFSLPTGPPVSTTCAYCHHKHRIGGPIWNGRLHDEEFVKKMLSLSEESGRFATGKRMFGMLSVINEELLDVLLYYTINSLCAKLHCEMMPLRTFRYALLHGGYRVSLSHCKTNSVKTDAPIDVVWDILRCWVQEHPVSEKRLQDNSVASVILKQVPKFKANFNPCSGAVSNSEMSGLLRFQVNPQPYWGPGTRSKANTLSSGNQSKKIRNQNKHKRNLKDDEYSNDLKCTEHNMDSNTDSSNINIGNIDDCNSSMDNIDDSKVSMDIIE